MFVSSYDFVFITYFLLGRWFIVLRISGYRWFLGVNVLRWLFYGVDREVLILSFKEVYGGSINIVRGKFYD